MSLKARKSPIIVSTPSGTQSNYFSNAIATLPIARKASFANTISSTIVPVQPMSPPNYNFVYMDFKYNNDFYLKYTNGVFEKTNELENNRFRVSYGGDMKVEYIIEIMNENKSSIEIEKLIEDGDLRNQIISILRMVKIRNLLK